MFVESHHVGNRQSSDEEVQLIVELVGELMGRTRLGDDGIPTEKGLTLADFLFVAPFNMQVRKLERALGPDSRVGSVDKFQGQEAPVAIVVGSPGLGLAVPSSVESMRRLNLFHQFVHFSTVVGAPLP